MVDVLGGHAVGGELLRRCERFVFDEAELLDRGELDQWLALFAEDCVYWLPMGADRREPRGALNLIYDDRRRLEDRVARLQSGFSHTEEPMSLTSHVIGNVRVLNVVEALTAVDFLQPGPDDLIVSARTIISRLRSHMTDVFAARVEWLLRPTEDGFSIRMKRTDLLHRDEPLPALTFVL